VNIEQEYLSLVLGIDPLNADSLLCLTASVLWSRSRSHHQIFPPFISVQVSPLKHMSYAFEVVSAINK